MIQRVRNARINFRLAFFCQETQPSPINGDVNNSSGSW
ncbi:MAG: Uncharacterised protein [Cyanobium sp. ARS6]|nr:MAG: Uncharacterised protein [Cyanobium sp. ARS6]